MPPKDKRIDAYIANARPFARPVLKKLRMLVHKAGPQVTETIKWGMPSFEYKGPLFGIAAFKEHCVAGFWKHKLLKDPKGYLGERKNQGGEAMGNLGRITSLSDLPPDAVILDFIRQAVELNELGIKTPKKKPAPKKEPVIPKELAAALAKNKAAKTTFENFSPSHRREYIEWIAEAKTEPTKNKRVATTLEWLAAGKSRNWKYTRTKN